MGLLSDKELEPLVPADQVDSGTPIPTRLVSSDEYLPIPQTERQKQVEARMNELGDDYGRKQRPVAPPLLPDRRRHDRGLRRR